MIELAGVSRVYRAVAVSRPSDGLRGEAPSVNALHGVNLRVEAGEFIAILGPSGSGKSTLLHILGFLDRPDAGQYRFQGQEVTRLSEDRLAALRNRFVGFVFQQFHLLPRATAVENVMLPLVYAGCPGGTDAALARIETVGLAARALHRPAEMSGGEQQRVAIARALVNDPPLILADEPTGNLDSKSEGEIVNLLVELNRQGKTVVMVTHEEELAQRASRILRLRDGRIVEDRPAADRSRTLPGGVTAPGRPAAQERSRATGARTRDHATQALRALRSHKMRSALSMLGILIGVGAVIAMLAVTQGARASLDLQLSRLGSNLLMVHPVPPHLRGVAMESGAFTRLSLEDAAALAKEPGVRRACATVMGRGQLLWGGKNWNTMVMGVQPEYAEMHASAPVAGRFFTAEETGRRDKVAVIGATVARELFGGANPLGQTLRINRIAFQVIGVLPAKGGGGWRDWDDLVAVPVTTAMFRLLGTRYVHSIDVEAADAGSVELATASVFSALGRRNGSQRDVEKSLEVRDMTELKDTIGETTRTMGRLLGAIAGISLVVGGIGVMNIMLVSVTERTREIGLRKALGARRRDILAQFLVEAMVMTFLGGVFGVGAGVGCAAAFAGLAKWPIRVSGLGIAAAVVFSVGVGLAFGMWPARRAAGLDPIEALRYE